MAATVVPSILISLVLFFLISLTTDVAASTAEIEAARATLAEAFNISLVCLLPLVLLIAFSIIKFPAFLSIFLTAIFSGVLAIFTQPDLVIRFAGDPDLSEPLAYIKGIYAAMATGFVSSTGIEAIDSLFSRGGMSGMLSTVWLILGALGFGAIMERAGFLDKLVSSVLAKAKSGGALVATVIGTAIGLNIIAADQYIAIVLPRGCSASSSSGAATNPRCSHEPSRTRGPSLPYSFRGTPVAPITPECWAFRLLRTSRIASSISSTPSCH